MSAVEKQRQERAERNAEIIRLDSEDHLSSEQIAERTGLTARYIRRILAAHRERTYQQPPTPPAQPTPPDTPSNDGGKNEVIEPWDTTDLTDEELKVELRGTYLAQFRLLSSQFRQLNRRMCQQLRTGEPTTRIRDVTASAKMIHDMMLTAATEARQIGTTKPVRPARPRPIPRRGPEIVPPPGAPRSVDDMMRKTGTDG